MSAGPTTLAGWAHRVLTCAEAGAKAALSREAAAFLRDHPETPFAEGAAPRPPDRPARPSRPELRAPRDMPKRRPGGREGRVALLHAIAHIELNAIDLAWDLILRFGAGASHASLADWARIGGEEARHFVMIAERLGELGAAYGDLPAHDGLWRAAEDTADDVLARLALAPLVLEARGLDVHAAIEAKLRAAGDETSARIIAHIRRDEIGHVAAGLRWFEAEAAARGLEPVAAFRAIVAARFTGRLKPPFDHAAREAAGMARAYYDPPPR